MRNDIRRFNQQFRPSRSRRLLERWILNRHPFAVPIATFLFLALCTLVVIGWLVIRHSSLNSQATDIVIISYDHNTQIVPSHEPTVGALLSKLQIPVHEGDVVEPAPDTAINQDDFRINIYRATPVRIVDAGQPLVTKSAATTPRSIANQAGLTLYAEDGLTERPVDDFLKEMAIGNVLVIDRSTPVTLTVNGFASATRTRAKTVGDFLAEKHIKLDASSFVQPAPDTPITADAKISVSRDGVGLQSVTQDIPMPTQYVDDDSLAYGTFALRQIGSPGKQVVTYQVTVRDGQVINSTVVQTVVTQQPVPQIEARGTNLSGIKGDMARAGISVDDYQYVDYIVTHESGWCPTKWQGEYGGCPAYHGTPSSPDVGYGLCQSTPGWKMAAAGDDWATNPVTQLSWCSQYAQSRYGGWYYAYQHWLSYHNW